MAGRHQAQPKVLARGIGRGAALIGLGALVFCGLGILETIGELRASDVNVRHGLSIIPFDWHLRLLCIRGAMRWPQLCVAPLAGATVFALAFDAFFMADRLPFVEVRERTGVTGGPLIANRNGLIFVGDPGGLALHHEMPVSRAVSVRLFERQRPHGRSLLEVVGL